MLLACQSNNIYNSFFVNWMDNLKEYSKMTHQFNRTNTKPQTNEDSKKLLQFKQLSSNYRI